MSEQSESELEEAVVILKLSRFCLVSALRLYERSTTAVEEEVAGDDVVVVVVVAASVAEAAAAAGWMVVVEDNIRCSTEGEVGGRTRIRETGPDGKRGSRDWGSTDRAGRWRWQSGVWEEATEV